MGGTTDNRGVDTNRRVRSLTAVLLGAAIAIALITRLGGLVAYTDFYGDEARDAFRLAEFVRGSWPTLGPEASLVPYRLPPLYYYLIAPTALFGSLPVLQAVPNALCSIASVPLLFAVVMRLLAGVPRPRRELIAAFAALWWSITFVDLFIANREWNPGPIPCFLLAIVLLWAHQGNRGRSAMDRIGTASAIGVLLALLVSMHSSTLFVVPVAFFVMSVVQITSGRNAWLEPAGSLLVAVLCLTPYWIGESAHGWANTQAIVATIFAGGSTQALGEGTHGLIAHLRNAFHGYTGVTSQFIAPEIPVVLRRALVLAWIALPFVALPRFRGDRRALLALFVVWITFLVAVSNVTVVYPHFRLPLAFAPILLVAVILGSATQSRTDRVLVAACAVFVAVSLSANGRMDAAYFKTKFAPQHLPSASDVAGALRLVPAGSHVCELHDLYDDWLVARYIDSDVVHGGHSFRAECGDGDYVVIPRYAYLYESREDYEMTDYRVIAVDPRSSAAVPRSAAELEAGTVTTTSAMQILQFRQNVAGTIR